MPRLLKLFILSLFSFFVFFFVASLHSTSVSAATCSSTDPNNPCPGDWLCFNEFGNGDGQNGFYKADFDQTTHVYTGKKALGGYCGRNFQCISATKRRELGLPVNSDSPCYAWCQCAVAVSDIDGYGDPGIESTKGNNVVDADGNADGWGYFCGDSDHFPSDYKDTWLDSNASKDVLLPKAMCGAQTVCQPGVHDGIVKFVPIKGTDDCSCDTSNGQSFTCTFSGGPAQHRTCGKGQVCDPNIKWGWPCRDAGSTDPIPTPPTTCNDPSSPDSYPSQSGSGSFAPSNTPFPLPCLEGYATAPVPGQALPPVIAGPSDKIIVCTKYASGLGSINTNISDFIGTIFAVILGLSGGTALLLIIYSGYQLSLSQGNPEKVKEARERLTAAIVGLLFIIFSTTILQIIGVNVLHIAGFVKIQ